MSASLTNLLFVGIGLVVLTRLMRGFRARRAVARSAPSENVRPLLLDEAETPALLIDNEAPLSETAPLPPASDGAPKVSSLARRDSLAAIYRTIYGPGLCSPR